MFFIVLIFNYEVTRLTMSAAGALIIKYQFLVGTSHQPHPPPSNLCGRGYVTTVSPATTGYNCFIYLDIDISLCGVALMLCRCRDQRCCGAEIPFVRAAVADEGEDNAELLILKLSCNYSDAVIIITD